MEETKKRPVVIIRPSDKGANQQTSTITTNESAGSTESVEPKFTSIEAEQKANSMLEKAKVLKEKMNQEPTHSASKVADIFGEDDFGEDIGNRAFDEENIFTEEIIDDENRENYNMVKLDSLKPETKEVSVQGEAKTVIVKPIIKTEVKVEKVDTENTATSNNEPVENEVIEKTEKNGVEIVSNEEVSEVENDEETNDMETETDSLSDVSVLADLGQSLQVKPQEKSVEKVEVEQVEKTTSVSQEPTSKVLSKEDIKEIEAELSQIDIEGQIKKLKELERKRQGLSEKRIALITKEEQSMKRKTELENELKRLTQATDVIEILNHIKEAEEEGVKAISSWSDFIENEEKLIKEIESELLEIEGTV